MQAIHLIVFLPLLASILVGLNTRRLSVGAAQFITAGAVSVAAILSYVVFVDVFHNHNSYVVTLLRWVDIGSFQANWALKVDSVTSVMLVLVTTVSALVHIYSVGYMSHDAHRQRFMSYLSLFTFFMLVLVTSDNLLQVFVGWEGVGVCSYLLIGFWYHKESANLASMKAFLVNRVGDFGLALGVAACYFVFGSVEFDVVFAQAEAKSAAYVPFLGWDIHAITLICVLLFIGCMGKSAQFGLHTWLPDAMEGPTPVSALIHAATMVTAGVFLVVRCSPLFEQSPVALSLVTLVGAVTCIFAASIALTQHDIKRVIAYSTCSQLGYMFFACGVSAYSAGMFHLLTHGFFKALLFLGAGSVIHAMSDEQDMRNMGGLWRKIPVTYAMMLIGTLAIVGMPPLSGFFSKDLIIESAYGAGHELHHPLGMFAFWLGIAAATMTAFYSWRLIFLTFHGPSRASKKVQDHVHESPFVMLFPLIVLSLGALFVGYILYGPYHIGAGDLSFWQGAITMLSHDGHNVLDAAHHSPLWVKLAPLAVGVVGLITAFVVYIWKFGVAEKIVAAFKPLHQFLYRKWYVDELYDTLFVRPTKWLGRFLWLAVDTKMVDGYGPNGAANLARKIGALASRIQTGLVYHYALVMLLGVIGLLTWIAMKEGMLF